MVAANDGPSSAAYPPEPWDLRGQLHASAFLVPAAHLPDDVVAGLPDQWRPVRVGRFAVVGAAWVIYEPGGVLSYRELLATVLVRRGVRVAPSIVRIWVDDVASRDGGRALWGIPKELARFDVDHAGRGRRTRAAAHTGDGTIGIGTISTLLRLPSTWPISFSVVQRLAGVTKVSPVRSRASLVLSRGRWITDPFGPLGFLEARRPLVSFGLRDFRMSFGATIRDGAGGASSDEPVVNAG